jgi:hypothetical protein
VRISAINTLINIQDAQVLPILIASLKDIEKEIQILAINAIYSMNDDRIPLGIKYALKYSLQEIHGIDEDLITALLPLQNGSNMIKKDISCLFILDSQGELVTIQPPEYIIDRQSIKDLYLYNRETISNHSELYSQKFIHLDLGNNLCLHLLLHPNLTNVISKSSIGLITDANEKHNEIEIKMKWLAWLILIKTQDPNQLKIQEIYELIAYKVWTKIKKESEIIKQTIINAYNEHRREFGDWTEICPKCGREALYWSGNQGYRLECKHCGHVDSRSESD